MEGGGGYVARDGVCLFFGEVPEEAERAGAGVTAEGSPSKKLVGLLGGGWLPSFANCVGERMCVDGLRLFDGDSRIVFVQSRIISRGVHFSLDDCDEALTVCRSWRTERRVPPEQRVFAGQKFGAQRRLLSSFVLI